MNQFKRALKMDAGRLIKKVCCFEEIYTIAYRKRNGKSLLNSSQLPLLHVPYNDNFWYADPIVTSYNNDTYLFAECFDMRTQKGTIGCAKFDNSGALSDFQIVIEEPYHLSFPMIFEWGDDLYMIPESSDNMSLNLYRCEGDILNWKKIKEFPTRKPLVDTVVIFSDDRRVELLSSAINPENPLQYQWQKYTLTKCEETFSLCENVAFNEGKEYTYYNRMAGTLVNLDGMTILPTQESTSIDYGVNLYLNDFSAGDVEQLKGKKITVKDILVDGIPPEQMIGIHSYAATEQLEIVDVRYFRFSPKNRMRKILIKIKH